MGCASSKVELAPNEKTLDELQKVLAQMPADARAKVQAALNSSSPHLRTSLPQPMKDVQADSSKTCVQRVQEGLDAIAQREIDLNACMEILKERALKQAADQDAKIAGGAARRPLEGVPLLIKGNVDVAGTLTTNAMEGLAGWKPETTAPVVQKLIDAGAIPIAKTTLPEAAFGMWGWSKLHGLTRNPFNPKYTCGGSSMGTAVGLAAGYAPIGIGSDEDSLASMASLIPRPPRRDEAKLMTYAGKALRFLGQLANPASPEDVDRKFIIGFWLADDSISIFEPPQQNSGIVGGKFLERMVRNNPETGKRFTFKDFVVGGTIKVNCYEFKLVDVDAFSKKFIGTGGTTLRSSLYKSSPLDIMQNLQKRYEEAKEALRAAFHVMDEDRSGNITHSEFIQSLELLHYDIEEEDAEPLLIWFDPDWKGYISYADFCDAIIRAAKFPAFLKQYALEKSTNRNQPAPASQVLNTDAP